MTSEKPAAPDTEGPYKVVQDKSRFYPDNAGWILTKDGVHLTQVYEYQGIVTTQRIANAAYRAGQQEQAAKDEARRARIRERVVKCIIPGHTVGMAVIDNVLRILDEEPQQATEPDSIHLHQVLTQAIQDKESK